MPYHTTSKPRVPTTRSTSQLVCRIKVPTLAAHDSHKVDLEDVQPLASYSWVKESTPTIVVPGSPPIWAERTLPFTVQKDNTTMFVDQNGHRVPKHPLLPLVAAVFHMQPEFHFSAIDLVTDRNNLRKLLRWIRGAELDPTVKDFQFDVDLVGKTMLFTRRETKTVELANRGYGFGFESQTTKIPAALGYSPTGHHRIIRYNLDGLELLVRFELDACLPATASSASPDLSHLLDRLDSVGISRDHQAVTVSAPVPSTTAVKKVSVSPEINIISSGSLVPQSNIVELTTCSKKFVNSFNWSEFYPQLFLSQTTHHFLGLHDFGKFSAVEKRTLNTLSSGRVAEQVQGDFKKLAKVLHVIYDQAVEVGDGAMLRIVCAGGILSLHKRQDDSRALPDDVLELLKA